MSFIGLIAILAVWSAITSGAARERSRDRIPAIARVAGVIVGVDTLETLSKRWGPGAPTEGQHPMGARYWHFRDSYLWADGFDYNAADGRVINSLDVGLNTVRARRGDEAAVSSREGPRVFCYGVTLGMRRAEVLRRLRQRLPKPRERDGAFVWNIPGRVFVRAPGSEYPPEYYKNWAAVLYFDHGTLTEINLQCD